MPWADCRHGQSAAAPHPTDELGPWVAGQPLIPVSLGGRSGSTPATPARRACHCPVKGRLSQRGRPLCRAVDRNNEQRCRPLRWQSRDTCPPPPPPLPLLLSGHMRCEIRAGGGGLSRDARPLLPRPLCLAGVHHPRLLVTALDGGRPLRTAAGLTAQCRIRPPAHPLSLASLILVRPPAPRSSSSRGGWGACRCGGTCQRRSPCPRANGDAGDSRASPLGTGIQQTVTMHDEVGKAA